MNKELFALILGKISNEVKRQDAIVTPQRQQQMATALVEFIDDSIQKYCRGAIEHGDSDITSINLDEAIRQEQHDTFWYLAAKNWK